MVNRWSVNLLLKSIVATMSVVLVVTFALGAWDAYGRYTAAERTATLTNASGAVFRALNGLRLDRSFTDRALKADSPAAADRKQVQDARATEVPAMKDMLATLDGAAFAAGKTYVATVQRSLDPFVALQSRTLAAFDQPKAARPESLAKDYMTATTDLIDTLDKLSVELGAAVKGQDPSIDEMMTLKELGWIARSAAGDGSVTLSNSLIAGQLIPNGDTLYPRAAAQVDTAWAALQTLGYGTVLPAKYVAALAKAKSAYFSPDLVALRDRLFKDLAAGRKPDISAQAWSGQSVPAIQTLLDVILAALDSASDRAAALRSDALVSLAMHVGFLLAALLMGVGSLFAIGARVIRPLHAIRDGMVKLASGDLAVEVGYASRHDEIGALAGTLTTFKQNAAAKAKIEEEQAARRAEAMKRQESVATAIKSFEGEIGGALASLEKASQQMRGVSEEIAGTAAQNDTQVQTVVGAAAEASKNVNAVASSAEELSASSTEISSQVTKAAGIASRAVEEAKQTDATMQGLVGATTKIGEVVELITSIAGQTNLLALNATIEAARAGEAGKGFAVVASEVKSLANQTAKATQDISAQIVAVQNVTKDAVEAIQRIGGTIAEVSEVATAIAAAVEEQAAATQEIKRSTHEAARRTEEVSSNMMDVAGTTEKTGEAAHGVQTTAKLLNTEADHLRREIDGFLTRMRAA